jgi:hypothetical protein
MYENKIIFKNSKKQEEPLDEAHEDSPDFLRKMIFFMEDSPGFGCEKCLFGKF